MQSCSAVLTKIMRGDVNGAITSFFDDPQIVAQNNIVYSDHSLA